MTVENPKARKNKWIPSAEELKKVEALASRGMTEENIAHCLGIRPETLSKKKHEFEQLVQAIKRGKAKGIAMVTNELLKNIQLGNVTAQIFYLKSQAGWKEAKDEPNTSAQSLIQSIIDKL